MCVCLSVSQLSSGWIVWATDLKSGMRHDLDNISDEFEGQGQRSRSPCWKMWFSKLLIGWIMYIKLVITHDVIRGHAVTWRHAVTSRHDVMLWYYIVMMSWVKKNMPENVLRSMIISCCNVWNVCVRRSMGQEYWQGYVAGGRVNAQAFSLEMFCVSSFSWSEQLNTNNQLFVSWKIFWW